MVFKAKNPAKEEIEEVDVSISPKFITIRIDSAIVVEISEKGNIGVWAHPSYDKIAGVNWKKN